MPIYFIQYEARPTPNSQEFLKYGGGFVNCWVKASSPEKAREVATKAINENGWHILTIEEDCREVSEHSYLEEKEGLEYYEQATLDGECYVFHTWGNESQEENERH